MFDISKKIAIFGVGGLAKDVFYCIKDILASKNIDIEQQIVFVDKNNQQRYSYNDREWRYIPPNVSDPFISTALL